MNPDDLLPTVTAIVGYDIYPHYLVTKGKLLPGAGLKPRQVHTLRILLSAFCRNVIMNHKKLCFGK